MADVTVCIPTIPPRGYLLDRALRSVHMQTERVAAIALAYDTAHDGAWATRNRAMAMSRTEWTLFLDDDDELLPNCVATLLDLADSTPADVVWGWFKVIGGSDPFPHYRGRNFDPSNPHIVPITYMARTRLLHEAAALCGGFASDELGAWDAQDLPMLRSLHELGARFATTDETLWVWHHHPRNTSGLPSRW